MRQARAWETDGQWVKDVWPAQGRGTCPCVRLCACLGSAEPERTHWDVREQMVEGEQGTRDSEAPELIPRREGAHAPHSELWARTPGGPWRRVLLARAAPLPRLQTPEQLPPGRRQACAQSAGRGSTQRGGALGEVKIGQK